MGGSRSSRSSSKGTEETLRVPSTAAALLHTMQGLEPGLWQFPGHTGEANHPALRNQ
jgi:hypothetical protein